MKAALLEGDDAHHPQREKAPRLQPGGPTNFSLPSPGHSASARPHQGKNTPRVILGADVLRPGWRIFGQHSQRARLVARIRLRLIVAVMRDRAGGPCLTDDAILFFEEALPLLAIACGPSTFEFNTEEWVALNAPRLAQAQVEEAVARTLPNPPKYTSADIGRRLNVTEEEWRRLKLWHLRPAGWTRAILTTKRKERRAANRKATRLATGVTVNPHELSVAQLKPWTLPGAPCTSRTGFFRMPKGAQAGLLELARSLTR